MSAETDNGLRPRTLEWNGLHLRRPRRDMYFEHPNVLERSKKECDAFRFKNMLHVIRTCPDPLPKPVFTLSELPLPDWMFDAFAQHGFEQPSAIQCQAWPVVLSGQDCVLVDDAASCEHIGHIVPMFMHA